MNLNVSLASPPVLRVSRQKIDVSMNVNFIIDVLEGGEVMPIACILLVSFHTLSSGLFHIWFVFLAVPYFGDKHFVYNCLNFFTTLFPFHDISILQMFICFIFALTTKAARALWDLRTSSQMVSLSIMCNFCSCYISVRTQRSGARTADNFGASYGSSYFFQDYESLLLFEHWIPTGSRSVGSKTYWFIDYNLIVLWALSGPLFKFLHVSYLFRIWMKLFSQACVYSIWILNVGFLLEAYWLVLGSWNWNNRC